MRTITIKPLEEMTNTTDDKELAALVALDDPDEWASFSTMQDNGTGANQWESHLVVEGMHCASCALNVEKTVAALSGVISANVNATSGRASIIWSSDETKPSTWMGAINKSGYNALPAADALMRNDRRKGKRLMLWR